jgi:hypothetical protein
VSVGTGSEKNEPTKPPTPEERRAQQEARIKTELARYPELLPGAADSLVHHPRFAVPLPWNGVMPSPSLVREIAAALAPGSWAGRFLDPEAPQTSEGENPVRTALKRFTREIRADRIDALVAELTPSFFGWSSPQIMEAIARRLQERSFRAANCTMAFLPRRSPAEQRIAEILLEHFPELKPAGLEELAESLAQSHASSVHDEREIVVQASITLSGFFGPKYLGEGKRLGADDPRRQFRRPVELPPGRSLVR